MKNKKGFTLIELLAVIVILAIIALIAVPIILKIIDNSKESSAIRSTELYLDTVETNLAAQQLNGTLTSLDGEYEITSTGLRKGDIEIKIPISGTRPDTGTLTINEKGKIISIQNFTMSGYPITLTNGKLSISKSTTDTINSSPVSWFNYEENETGITITGPTDKMREDTNCTDINDIGFICKGEDFDLIIPEKINNKIVTIIGKKAFSGFNAKKIVIPNTVTRIEENAFYQGTMNGEDLSLIELKLSNNLNYIGHGAFAYNNLTEVIIPEGIVELTVGNPFYSYIEKNGAGYGYTFDKIVLPSTLKKLTSPYSGYYGLLTDNVYKGVIINKSNLIVDWTKVAQMDSYSGECEDPVPDCTFATGTCIYPCGLGSFKVVSE